MSNDPNDIIQKGIIPPWMEKVADQGGWKEAEKTLTVLAKIKPQAWKAMGETIETLGNFLESGITEGFSDIKQDLTDSLSLTIQEALSPLKNEVEQALAEALAPIMPEIQAFTTEIADWFVIAIGSWKGIITGDWDAALKEITDKMPDWFKTMKNDFRDRMDDLINNISSGSIEGLGGMPGLPSGVGIGFNIADAIVSGWVGFWESVGWV